MKGLKNFIGKTDIYLLDQILKERYHSGQKILDAGCGSGRNLTWFYKNTFEIYGVDSSLEKVVVSRKQYPKRANQFSVEKIDNLSFKKEVFDHIICSAVLHFATSESHLFSMLSELIRVLKPNGTLFIRMASNIGLEKQVQLVQKGVYKVPDGTERFLLTKPLLSKVVKVFSLELLEPLKTVNVNDKRCMSTLVFKKTSL